LKTFAIGLVMVYLLKK